MGLGDGLHELFVLPVVEVDVRIAILYKCFIVSLVIHHCKGVVVVVVERALIRIFALVVLVLESR